MGAPVITSIEAPADPDPARTTSSAPTIEAHDLGRRFGDFWAIRDASFNVAPGEVFGLLDANAYLIAAATTAVAALGLRVGVVTFGRETILTRWK